MTNTKIWFNRWFSTAYHYINMIKDNEDNHPFEFYGTHKNIASVVLQACDYVEQEPRGLSDSEYVDFCLDFCKRHTIDVFVPQFRATAIAERVKEFHDNGTKVLVMEDVELMKMIDDKGAFFDSIKENQIMTLPDYHIVHTAEEFKQAYEDLTLKGHRVCFKPVKGIGGAGFRVIDETIDPLKALFGTPGHTLTFDDSYSLLSGVNSFESLMVSEYLEGREYSIDCISYDGKLLAAVPRGKMGGRVRFLEDNPELLEIAQKVNDTYKIPFIYNIQVRYNHGVPKLLEINPRMSGGLYITCLSGINYPYIAIKLLLEGKIVDVPNPKFNITATHIEKNVILDNQS